MAMANIDNIIRRGIEHKHIGGSVIKGKLTARFLNLSSNRVADVDFNENNEVTEISLYSNAHLYIETKKIKCNDKTTDDEVYKMIADYLW